MNRSTQLVSLLHTAVQNTPRLNIHNDAAAVLVLNELLLEKLERLLPDCQSTDEAQHTITGLIELCNTTTDRLRASLDAL